VRIPAKPVVQRVISWLVILDGILLAMFVIAAFEGGYLWIGHPIRAILIFITEFLPLLASLMALRKPRLAARIYLWTAPLATLLVCLFPWHFGAGWGGAIFFFAGVLLPGLFWLFTSRRGWPVAMKGPFLPGRPRLTKAGAGAGLYCCLAAMALIPSWFVYWWDPMGCEYRRPLLYEDATPLGIDFTAKIVWVAPRSLYGKSLWSIARIEQRFSGVPWCLPNVIILRNFFKPGDQGQRFFVQGSRSEALLSRFLPIIQPFPCGHTKHLEEAALAIEVLRDVTSRTGVRIVGQVLIDRGYSTESPPPLPVPGATILIQGPAGSTTLVTNTDGIYDATGLPPGHYSVQMVNSLGEIHTFDLKPGGVKVLTFRMQARTGFTTDLHR
jgi:hypothetical protein